MPNDNYKQHEVNAEFEEEINNIETLCMQYSHVSATMLVGDMNMDLQRNNAHSKALCDLAERYGLFFCKNHLKANYEYTYGHTGLGQFSCIDHYVIPNVLSQYVEMNEWATNKLNPSFHVPLKIVFNINVDKLYVTERSAHKTSIAWHRVNEQERNHYKQYVHNRLENMYVPRNVIMCDNVTCRNENHRQQLSMYCRELIQQYIIKINKSHTGMRLCNLLKMMPCSGKVYGSLVLSHERAW